jgi:hypothetical protein
MLAVSYYFNEGDFFFGKSGGDDTTAVGAVCRYAFHPRRYSGSLRCCVSAGLRRRCASRQPVSDGAFVLPHGPGWSRLRWVAQYTAPPPFRRLRDYSPRFQKPSGQRALQNKRAARKLARQGGQSARALWRKETRNTSVSFRIMLTPHVLTVASF